MQSVDIGIGGMTCAACAARVEYDPERVQSRLEGGDATLALRPVLNRTDVH